MRLVYVCAVIASLATPMAAVSMDPVPSSVTVVLDLKGNFSRQALLEMQRESSQIIRASGVRLDFRSRADAASGIYSDLVVMTFKGSCTFDPAPPIYDETGPYAITRTANGEVQPFGEVDCDRVVNSVRSAMFGADYGRADQLIGRALGRVVAHEIVHMLTKSGQHGREGVEKAALSGRQLISASLPLSALDIDRLRQERRQR
ncbi:MAG: hypothetical protein M3N54_10085 [Acidobacteriota bacterium]|nr:hypothetical protein [Acidobacteriota bacterium]